MAHNKITHHNEKAITHVSLAHRRLKEMPLKCLRDPALKSISSLDLSYNNFRNLAFLKHFEKLQTLVLDRNPNLDHTTFPEMDHLEILWLNNCNLININEWLTKLQVQCKNLTHLQMMCNPVGPTILNGVSSAEEDVYRQQVLLLLPKLEYFDGVAIKSSSQLSSTWSPKLLEDALRRKWTSMYVISTNLQKKFSVFEYFTFRRLFLNLGLQQTSNY